MNRRTFLKQAAAVGIGLGSVRLLAQGVSGQIRGRVTSRGEPLAGVRCSDGRRVVVTDKAGRFVIPTAGDSGPFVFVVTPWGHWSDRFFVPVREALTKEAAFDLAPIGSSEAYTAVFLADIHLGEGVKEQSYLRFKSTVAEINARSDRPAFVLAGGDITLQSKQGPIYAQIMSTLAMPVRHTLGNHEMIVEAPDPRARFGELFGPTYYSFDYGHVHYVVLDGCNTAPQNEGFKNVIGEVGPTELAWLEEDLRAVPKGMPTVVALHIPLMSTFCERRKTTAKDAPWWVVRNADEVIGLLSQFNVAMVLQGHLHENERIHHGSIEFVETVAVSGNWWREATGIERGTSGEPRGYRILDVDGETVRHRYVSSAESHTDDGGEFVGVTDGRLPAGRELVVNIYDASNEAKVSGRIDDGHWIPWPSATSPGSLSDLTAGHHWQCPAHLLTAGEYHVEVRCTDPGRSDVHVRTNVHIT